jgi:hypothetical protein
MKSGEMGTTRVRVSEINRRSINFDLTKDSYSLSKILQIKVLTERFHQFPGPRNNNILLQRKINLIG